MFLAAAVGSAVGISNVWKFTYVAGENGGGAFVIIYVAAIVLIALPALIAEFLVGRRGGASVVKTMDLLAQRERISPAWRYYGIMAALGAFIALSFYAVVAGWTIDYFFRAMTQGFSGITAEQSTAAMAELMASPSRMIAGQSIFLGLTALTVAAGVKRGLERVLRWLTPALFMILLVLLAYAFVAGDIRAGSAFLFVPDFSKISMQTVLLAVGQAFFSLGIGLGVLLTIGAYMDSVPSGRAGVDICNPPGRFRPDAGGCLARTDVLCSHGRSRVDLGNHYPRDSRRSRRGLQRHAAQTHRPHRGWPAVARRSRNRVLIQCAA